MIGVVGSEDSVDLVMRVAEHMDLVEGLITRSYQHPEEAPAFAAEIDPACNVIMFTGRVPYALAHAHSRLTAITDYIPHSGVDLFRTLVMMMRDFQASLPRASIDTIDAEVVRENFEEIGEAPPEHIFALDPVLAEGGAGAATIVDFHQRHFADGDVEVCITCLSLVRDSLEAAGVPVVRVTHTHSAVRDSLHRATLTSRIQRLEAAQVAVVAVVAGDPSSRADAAALRLAFDDVMRVVGGRALSAGDASPTFESTRGRIERELDHRTGALAGALGRLSALGAWVAVGYGHSSRAADEQARYAVTVASALGDHHVVMPDGSTRRLVDGARTPMRVRDTDPSLQATARLGGIGPMTLARLQVALAAVGRRDVTAKDLSRAYGVEPRSARRLLNAMSKAGLAEPLGAQSPPKAGRPQLIYKIDLDALLRADPSALPHPDAPSSERSDFP